MAEQNVTLQPGESKVISFEAVPQEAKTYQVSVDGLFGSFIAKIVAGDITVHSAVVNGGEDGWAFIVHNADLSSFMAATTIRGVGGIGQDYIDRMAERNGQYSWNVNNGYLLYSPWMDPPMPPIVVPVAPAGLWFYPVWPQTVVEFQNSGWGTLKKQAVTLIAPECRAVYDFATNSINVLPV